MSAPSPFTPPASDYPGETPYRDLTIANGASLSDAVDLNTMTPVAVLMSAAWTSAGLSFVGSCDGSTYGAITDKDGEVVVATLAGGEYVVLDPLSFIGVRWLKIRSGTAGSAVNQGGARTLRLVGRRL